MYLYSLTHYMSHWLMADESSLTSVNKPLNFFSIAFSLSPACFRNFVILLAKKFDRLHLLGIFTGTFNMAVSLLRLENLLQLPQLIKDILTSFFSFSFSAFKDWTASLTILLSISVYLIYLQMYCNLKDVRAKIFQHWFFSETLTTVR